MKPTELNMSGVDMQALATTQYMNATPLDVRRDFAFTIVVGITNVGGGAAGAAKLTVQVLAKDKTTVLHEADVLTDIVTLTAGNPVDDPTTNRNVLRFGYSTAPVNEGSATLDSTAAQVVSMAKFINIVLEVTTANDGTTSVADVDLLTDYI